MPSHISNMPFTSHSVQHTTRHVTPWQPQAQSPRKPPHSRDFHKRKIPGSLIIPRSLRLMTPCSLISPTQSREHRQQIHIHTHVRSPGSRPGGADPDSCTGTPLSLSLNSCLRDSADPASSRAEFIGGPRKRPSPPRTSTRM